ncbi:putative tail protein [Xanthomonas phage Langgrundblatt2]|uniref:Tail protein n=2 Tax=Shirevirus TaxID=3153128 RepID=A0A9E7E1M4_9CAUD|nr:putative tail protein [Xanthomonas phage Langgrundblatt1]YP_010742928.1 putative tail protein [Xanthomonas phage Langgrundblatt2]URA06810.1 putative tail protein [Xanthomonas phage Langgrundblatt1]URA06879.1 putative tail protein [Xanthomonas phage Langgrundblatt2]
MAGLFGSITIKGNRLTEFAAQTSTVGIPIPFGFGKFPCEGNIIFAPMPPKEHVKKKKQGKGGVKSEEYSYTLSYAIAFCEGPIYGFWTIKRNGKVVWTQDPDASVDDKAYAAKWAQKATFYFGTETQMPDSTIESYKGAGKVSAHRGIAYIVVEDDDVTDNGGAVPTYEAICIAIGTSYATTPPYRLESTEALITSADVASAKIEGRWNLTGEYDTDASVTDVEIRLMRISHTADPEEVVANGQVTEIEVRQMREIYTAQPELVDANANVSAIEVLQQRIVLDRMQETKFETDTSVTAIEVITP